jgi:hypothetical protein
MIILFLIACFSDDAMDSSGSVADTSDTGRDTADLWAPLDTTEGYY